MRSPTGQSAGSATGAFLQTGPTPIHWASARRHEAPPRRRRRFAVTSLVLALMLGACQAGASPVPSTAISPTAAGDGVELVADAAVSATIGPGGGELTTADPARGRSYRLTIPAGAFEVDTTVTMTPIATLGGVDGLLGGVELEPTGAAFYDAPAMLEIGLDGEQAAALTATLSVDQVVAGFRYAESPTDLHPSLARASADGATVTVPLVTFSGHGAGTRPASPEMARLLAALNSPQRDDDEILRLLREWELAIEDALRVAVRYYEPDEWFDAYREASLWHFIASNLGYLSGDKWYTAGDGMRPEATQLQVTIDDGWPNLVRDVNDDCRIDGAADLAELGRIWQQVHSDGWSLPAFNQILTTATFCYGYEFTANPAPVDLEEGQSQDIKLSLFQLGTAPAATDAQLQAMDLKVTAVATDSSLVRLSGHRPATSQVRITAVALRAVAGNRDEGAFTLNVSVLGIEFYDVSTISFDIRPSQTPPPTQAGPISPAGPITCAGDPATTTYQTGERIAIVFDGRRCTLVPGLNDDDDPNVALVLATVGGYAQWNGGSGSDWSRKGAGDGEEPGFYFVTLTRNSTGDIFQMDLEVVMTVLGADDVEITVRNVSIRPEGVTVIE